MQGPAAAAAVSPDSPPSVANSTSPPKMSSEGLLDRAAAGASASAVALKFGSGGGGGSGSAAPDEQATPNLNKEQTWKNLPQALQNTDRRVCGVRVSKQTVDCVTLSIVFVCLVAAGGGIFSLIEHPTELQRIAEVEKSFAASKSTVMAILRQAVAGNLTNTTANDLYARLQDSADGFQAGPNTTDNWTWVNAMVFAFTVVTTIGYGTFTPSTALGQVFLVLLALVGIPAAGISLAYISERLMYLITYCTQRGEDVVVAAFQAFDDDGSGELEGDELRSALGQLGFDLTDHQFKDVLKRLDTDSSGTVDLEEFKQAMNMLHCDLTEPAGRKRRTRLVVIMIILWVAMGVVSFTLTEGWDPVQAFYFTFGALRVLFFLRG